jgi:hypothetical protein
MKEKAKRDRSSQVCKTAPAAHGLARDGLPATGASAAVRSWLDRSPQPMVALPAVTLATPLVAGLAVNPNEYHLLQ